MKRQISISIFLSILVIILAFLYIKFFNANKSEEQKKNEQLVENITENLSVPISQEYQSYLFFIKEEYGRLVVFETKTQEFYMDTGIESWNLPNDLQKELERGIFFKTESELYDFLENYSS